MKTVIKADGLSKTIAEQMGDYSDDVIDAIKICVDKETDESFKVLKDNAPVRKGDYKKSLKKSKHSESLTEKTNVLHSKKLYMRSHLLERPHATRSGGRTKAIPHFEPAEKHVKENLEKDIKTVLKQMK